MANATVNTARARAMHNPELTTEQTSELRQRMLEEREAVLSRVRARVELATPLESRYPDEMDEASSNQEVALLFRLADKEQNLIKEIDAALERIDAGSYGLCEGTGEPIGYRRLLVRPWARFSVQHKEALERELSTRPGR
jgi:DnaK suppressor protein